MEALINPFKLSLKILVAAFKITCYIIVFFVQSSWYVTHLRPDKVGDAFGQAASNIIQALAEILQ